MNRATEFILASTLALAAVVPVAATPARAAATASAGDSPDCGDWEVTLKIDDAGAPLGSFQLDLDSSGADGQFVGDGERIDCTTPVPLAIFAAFGNAAEHTAAIGAAVVEGMAVGSTVASCNFSGHFTDPPVADDFRVTIIDALDVSAIDVAASIGVTVTALTQPGDCENRCGDAVATAPDEECDDANTAQDDACLNDCLAASCGDGIVETGVEQCDDGNTDDSDGCVGFCRLAVCGDGFVRAGVEACDDANDDDHDECVDCHVAYCGDGAVEHGVEQCDDGNSDDTDSCRNDCRPARCGDGIVEAGVEQCDDGNASNFDGCSGCTRTESCADPTGDGAITSTDALAVLARAVSIPVACPQWICDVDESGTVSALDALRVLRAAVDLPVALSCGTPTALLVRLGASDRLGSATATVQTNGDFHFVMSGSQLACRNLSGLPMTVQALSTTSIRVQVSSAKAFAGPFDLARCDITTPHLLGPPSGFETSVTGVRPNHLPAGGLSGMATLD